MVHDTLGKDTRARGPLDCLSEMFLKNTIECVESRGPHYNLAGPTGKFPEPWWATTSLAEGAE